VIEQLSFAPSQAIENTLRFLRDSCPPEGYLISFSGGKDSLAVLEACKEARVPYRYYYKVTTADPPELVKYIKRVHPDCARIRPPSGQSMYTMMGKKGLPTRLSRWCCEEFKEYPADIERGGHVLLGVRAAESVSRKQNWGLVRACGQIGGYKMQTCGNSCGCVALNGANCTIKVFIGLVALGVLWHQMSASTS
jgi:phosphoadenosine phosphosulfate reductase